jgi:uncharacterized protein YxjI
MKLLMKQRVFSWTDTYDVYDEAGNKKYFVKAELFRLGHQIHVFDVSGNEIGMIKQRLFTLLPSFDIVIGGREFGNIQKEFTFFKPRYEIVITDGVVREISSPGTMMCMRAAVRSYIFQRNCSTGEIPIRLIF